MLSDKTLFAFDINRIFTIQFPIKIINDNAEILYNIHKI